MNNGFELDGWVAGFFDAEGNIHVDIQKSKEHKTGFQVKSIVRMNQFSPSYIGGFFDGDGEVFCRIQKKKGLKNDYSFKVGGRIDAFGNSSRTVIDCLDDFCKQIGVKGNIYEIERGGNCNSGFGFQIAVLQDTKIFLEAIHPHLIEKREQAEIQLNQIIPRMERGDHLTKEGILEIAAWRDLMNGLKGNQGVDSKYTLDFFEELWGASLDEDKIPTIDVLEEPIKHESRSGSKSIKDW